MRNPFKKKLPTKIIEVRDGVFGPDVEYPAKGSDIDKLRWKAALESIELPFDIDVAEARIESNGVPVSGEYEVRVPGSSMTTGGYRSTWSVLNGVRAGAKATLYTTRNK